MRKDDLFTTNFVKLSSGHKSYGSFSIFIITFNILFLPSLAPLHDSVVDVDMECLKLDALAAARLEFQHASAPLLEKYVVEETAKLLSDCNRSGERDEYAAIFCELDEQYPDYINWTIL